MKRAPLSLVSALCLLIFSGSVSQAQLRQDALVQAPEIAKPARGTVGSALAGFELAPNALSRGSAALPTPFVEPLERGAPALRFLPSYLADQGLSEWGMGWGAQLTIRRVRPLGAIDYRTDQFSSPWGPLSQGDDGAYYVNGFEPRIRLQLDGNEWQAIDAAGTRYSFREADALLTPRGPYEWWISEAITLAGERTSYEYTAGDGGRRYLTRVRYGGRSGVQLTEVTLDYEPAMTAFIDRRSGSPVPLDRRVARVVASFWDASHQSYRERYRYELGYAQNPANVAHYLTSVQRVFASGGPGTASASDPADSADAAPTIEGAHAEPTARYHYRFGEEDALAATSHEASELSLYLARFGNGSLTPEKATYLDVDRDGRTDIENACAQDLARHTDQGMVFETLPRDGTEIAPCRPERNIANDPRLLVRLAPGQPELSVLRFVRPAADTTVYQCDRQGHFLASTQLIGDWRIGANTRLADIDRDLTPDLVRVTRGQVEVRRGVFSSSLSFEPSTRQALSPAVLPSRSWLSDLTGDGLADLVVVVRAALYVWPGFGNGTFEPEAVRLPLRGPSGGDLGELDDSELAFVDANRDGLTDVLLANGPTLRLLTHRGTHFQQLPVPAFSLLSYDSSYPITVDLEGTGEEQAIVSKGMVAYAISFTSPSAGLLVEADDSKGGKLTLQYERAPANPGIITRPPLLSGLKVQDAGNDALEYRFDYEAPVFHSQGEYLLGYRLVRRTSATAVDEADLHHDDIQVALPLGTRSYDTLTPSLPAGLFRYTETGYEVARYQGLTYQRPVLRRGGLRDADFHLAGVVTETTGWDSTGLCALQTIAQSSRYQLTTTRTLAAPSALEEALHCLVETEQQSGVHAGRPELDFSYGSRADRTPSGQVEQVTLLAGAEALIVQQNRYDEHQRLIETGSPGRGTTRVTYEPLTGDVQSVTAPDGSIVTATERAASTGAVLSRSEARGGPDAYVTTFGYDELERLASRFDNLGASTAEQPDERVSYAFATEERPASIVSQVLVDLERGATSLDAEWLSASGSSLAKATRIPEGWAVRDMTLHRRALAETARYHRAPLGPVDPHSLGLATLFDPLQSTPLSRTSTSLFTHQPLSEVLLQDQTRRSLTQFIAIDEDGLTRTTYENAVLMTTERFDGEGHLTESVDATGQATQVTYDALARVVAVSLPGGAEQRAQFDAFGRARSISRSGLGTVEFTYESGTGLLQERRYRAADGESSRSATTRYDTQGREIERRHTAGAAQQQYFFFYDGHLPSGATLPAQVGRLSAEQGPDYEVRSRFRPDGLLDNREHDLAGWRRVADHYDYFEDGVVRRTERRIRDSSGALVSSLVRYIERDAYGREVRVSIESDSDSQPRTLYTLEYDEEGRIARILLGEGAEEGSVQPHYDPATHAARGYSQFGSDWELEVDSQLDSRGLVAAELIDYRSGSTPRAAQDRVYRYDRRRLLVGMESPEESAAYGYDPSGLLTAITDSAGTRLLERTPTALTAAGTTYAFDSAGRLTSAGDLTLEYGPNGQVTRALRGATRLEFRYDSADQRVLKLRDGRPVAAYLGDSILTEEGYIEPLRVDGRIVGVIDDGLFHGLPVDARGSVLSRNDGTYLSASPYGVRMDHASLAQALDFAAKGYDSDLGLVRMGVRDYAPLVGQFTTPDPLFLADLAKCAGHAIECNLYGYAAGDPVGRVDPTGESATLVGAVVGGVLGGGVEIYRGSGFWKIMGSATQGAIAGAMVGSVIDSGGASLGVMAVAGAQGNIIGGIAGRAISGEGTTLADVAQDAAWGAGGGVVGVGVGKVVGAAAGRFSRATAVELSQEASTAIAEGSAAAEGVTGRVATRINLANGPTRFTPLRASGSPVSAGWQHVLEQHFDRAVANNRSVFTVAPDELRAILQSSRVVQSPVTAIGDGQFFRTVDVGRAIGTSSLNNGGGTTSVLKVFTDQAGNLITAFPR